MVDHAKIVERLAELRTTAEAAVTVGSNDPWSVLYDSHVVARVNGKPTYYSIAKELFTEHPETAHRCDGGDFDWGVCGPMRRLAGALGLEET